MRIAFAGTPDAAVPTLDGLVAAGHEIVAVITREDAPTGRKRRLTPSPVAARAAALELPIIKANRIDAEASAQILALEPELGVVVAYGGLIREPLLTGPTHGWINLHFSQLPKWRGAAPVQRAIMSGEPDSGIAVFQLEAGLDTGPTFVNRAVAIEADETAGELLARLAEAGVKDVLNTVTAIADGSATATPQTGEPTHAAKLETADGKISWQDTAAALHAQIRGVTPDPGAATTWNGERFKIHRVTLAEANDLAPGEVALRERAVLVGCGSGSLQLIEVQPAGKRAMAAVDWLRGVQDEKVTLG
ncbi:methionyl-tRNA formyltransferase [Gulosibacter chungangensis]|uniref:Methionyl-tRNA formyltransferase n=1 Tax=Gulosibacter chungangensis TaxID=979746 RepID=A0A7J5BFD2_9MICO|nr:methionyl-tRNA formyltransferase [Gulosibacter chungangensis]KAB1644083.1 methionyl-tRNA formyltransferase [Gulosibacter chungangensis]